MMDIKKGWVALLLPILAVSFLGAQSLAELSKKEKERRAAVKGKTTVITNANLTKLKKKAAVTVSQTEAAPGERPTLIEPQARPSGNAAPPAVRAPFTVQTAESGRGNLSEGEKAQTKEALKDRWAKAQEMVDLLTMKMNALWQRFYNMDDMTTRDKVQIEISDTYQKLLKAQDDEAKAKEDLETFLSNSRKD
jgi:hypothetical protein